MSRGLFPDVQQEATVCGKSKNFLFGCVCIALATLIFSTMEVVLEAPRGGGGLPPQCRSPLGRFLVRGGICLLPVAGWALYRTKTKLTGKDLRSCPA